ncbi:MAG: hydantoinase/carbamoylase family amidase [Sulfitobacter sp.]|uniref:hydantoinase/carbamoylase family amidase n=1 Tax=Sulfitobacter sp. TaxID=1903071 RepID=UPI003298881A
MSAFDRAKRLFAELAEISADPPGVTRASFGPLESAAHDLIRREAEHIGLEHRTDSIGNLYVTLPGQDRTAPVLMTGSHLDSVPHGGNYVGAAGVLAGLYMLEQLAQGPQPPCDITLMAIRAEEMIWFPEHYLGSRAAFGLLPKDAPERVKRSDTGRTLADHMTEAGFDPQAIRDGKAHLDPRRIRAFVEVHIEQGPILVEARKPIGIVTGIRGNIRHRFARIMGETTHAGGVPRQGRRDTVMAGAELVATLESWWLQTENSGGDMVLTIGEFSTDPAQHGITKVPGHLGFTLDMRSQDSNILDQFDHFLQSTVAKITTRRGVSIDLGPATRAAPAPMTAAIQTGLIEAARHYGVEQISLPSGGGHDCATFAEMGVAAGMLFIRNENGSHNPDEYMALEDFLCAAEVLTQWARKAVWSKLWR